MCTLHTFIVAALLALLSQYILTAGHIFWFFHSAAVCCYREKWISCQHLTKSGSALASNKLVVINVAVAVFVCIICINACGLQHIKYCQLIKKTSGMIHNSDFCYRYRFGNGLSCTKSGHKSWHMLHAAFCHFYKGIYYNDGAKHIADYLT